MAAPAPLPPGDMRRREYNRVLVTIAKHGNTPLNYDIRYRMVGVTTLAKEPVMDETPAFEGGIWRAFLQRHHLGAQEQEAFLDYVTRPGVQDIPDLPALEAAYLEFLRTGNPPVDPT